MIQVRANPIREANFQWICEVTVNGVNSNVLSADTSLCYAFLMIPTPQSIEVQGGYTSQSQIHQGNWIWNFLISYLDYYYDKKNQTD